MLENVATVLNESKTQGPTAADLIMSGIVKWKHDFKYRFTALKKYWVKMVDPSTAMAVGLNFEMHRMVWLMLQKARYTEGHLQAFVSLNAPHFTI